MLYQRGREAKRERERDREREREGDRERETDRERERQRKQVYIHTAVLMPHSSVWVSQITGENFTKLSSLLIHQLTQTIAA